MNGDPSQDLNRELLDEYLDEALSAADKARVEGAAAGDLGTSRLLSAMRADRAARAAVYASYLPGEGEAQEAAETLLAAASFERATAGRIGPSTWLRRFAAIAAAAAIVVGAFAVGRVTAPAKSGTGTGTGTVAVAASADHPYTVLYWNTLGEPQVRQFANAADVDSFVSDMETRQTGQVASVSYDETQTLSQEGSF